MITTRFLVVTCMLLSFSLNASSNDDKSLFLKYEKAYGLPKYLLYAMAHQESGRNKNGSFAPWPWALNIGGKAIYAESKQEAIKTARAALKKGQSFGGGYLQQEWRWQKDRYKDPADLFDPQINISTGAQILAEWYEKTGSWVESIARYHVGTVRSDAELARALDYVNRVRRYHEKLLSN